MSHKSWDGFFLGNSVKTFFTVSDRILTILGGAPQFPFLTRTRVSRQENHVPSTVYHRAPLTPISQGCGREYHPKLGVIPLFPPPLP